ncbi:hypothetical protein AVEN_230720-1 [Araneus ventricosus]|uniref:Uncharacterized protein n=1 Tax=Araneus ventricosus TaxID=182803 RepID=A0A4Y2A2G4_ARAVE|nr:hypothetical protein AVEN_230720-1 [Araneus ventricosus]
MLAAFDSGDMCKAQVSSPVTILAKNSLPSRCAAANVSDCKPFCIQCAVPTVVLLPSENKLSCTLASHEQCPRQIHKKCCNVPLLHSTSYDVVDSINN